MNLLNSQKTSSKLIELTKKHRNIAFSVAWASYENKVFDSFRASKNKIKYGVIGTHFFQTHWQVLDWCMKNEPNIGFIFDQRANVVFHPKIYLFWTGAKWDLLIGSANLTVGGMTNNTEIVLHVSSHEQETDDLKKQALETIESYWDRSVYIDRKLLRNYKERWDQEKRRNRERNYSISQRSSESEVEILSWSWQEYLREIRRDSKPVNRKAALLLLKRAREVFASQRPFHTLDFDTRRALAGSHPPTEGNWKNIQVGWFGYTRAYGNFSQLIYDNVDGDQLRDLSDGLDNIPIKGVVEREDYMKYVAKFKQALDGKQHGLGVAARLLTIKRPDTFTPWNGRNKRTLEQLLEIKPKLKAKHYERYWDEIIVPLRESNWCDSPRPTGNEELEIWLARVAMLDVFGGWDI